MNASVLNARFRRAIAIAALCTWIIPHVPTAQGSSAVAVALNPRDGRLAFGYWKGGASEKEARERAIRYCKSMGWLHPRVIHSTSREGYGAIVSFDKGDNKSHFAAAVAAETPKQAISDALQNAKAAGGRYAEVETLWSDGGGRPIDLSKPRWLRTW
jgi:hypothetical protein